jgi:hypothetical protein
MTLDTPYTHPDLGAKKRAGIIPGHLLFPTRKMTTPPRVGVEIPLSTDGVLLGLQAERRQSHVTLPFLEKTCYQIE